MSDNVDNKDITQEPTNGINFDVVKNYLTENKDKPDVKEFISGFAKVEPNVIEQLLEKDENWKKWGQSFTDKRVTSAIKTYADNTIPKLRQEIENEFMEKLNPKETAEQKRLREIEKKLNESEVKARRQELENLTMRKINEFGLENIGEMTNLFIHDSPDTINKSLEWLKERDKYMYERGRNSILKENIYEPSGGDDNEKLPFNSMAEYGSYLKKHPEAYDPVMYQKIASRFKK